VQTNLLARGNGRAGCYQRTAHFPLATLTM